MDAKWINWNKPETIISKMALEMHIPAKYLEFTKPGTFKFNDGTTQGWNIDQFYDTNDKNMTKISPYTNPNSKKFHGFTLSNYQNLGLAVSAYPMIVVTTASSLDFYLESPDLLSNQDWKNPKGYSLDVQRNFFSLCVDPPAYYVQLQVRMWDKSEKKMRIFGEWDDQTQTHIFHAVKSLQPYHFIWTATQFTDSNLDLRFLRLRFTQPNFTVPGAGECLPKGEWLVGNISPET